MKKNKMILFSKIILLFFLAISLIWIAVRSFAPEDKSDVEAYFYHNKDKIDIVTNYFIKSEYSMIHIKKNVQKDGFMDVGYNKKIEDSATADAIAHLLNQGGFDYIGKEGNTIFFQKWGMFEKEYGIAYSIDGEETPMLLYLTNLEQLSADDDGWFYFESDYNEWRIQNQ